MHITTYERAGRTFSHTSPDRPHKAKPVITREHVSDGVRMYETADGKSFNADMYDNVFGKPPVDCKIITDQELKQIRYRSGNVRGSKLPGQSL